MPSAGEITDIIEPDIPATPHTEGDFDVVEYMERGGAPRSAIPISTLADAQPTPEPFHVEPSSLQDIDILWDWIRADPEGVKNFMGALPKVSPDLFKWAQNVAMLERDGQAILRSVRDRGLLIGFVLVCPIVNKGGAAHIYIAPAARGDLAHILPALIHAADQQLPTITLHMIVKEDAWSELLMPLGFTREIVLTRRAVASGERDGV